MAVGRGTKEITKYVRYGACAGILLTACAAPLVLKGYKRRKRGKPSESGEKPEGIQERKTAEESKPSGIEKKPEEAQRQESREESPAAEKKPEEAQRQENREESLELEKKSEEAQRQESREESPAAGKKPEEGQRQEGKEAPPEPEKKSEEEQRQNDKEVPPGFAETPETIPEPGEEAKDPETPPGSEEKAEKPEERQESSGRKKSLKRILKCTAGGLYTVLILAVCMVPLTLLFLKTDGGAFRVSLPEIPLQEVSAWDHLQEIGEYFTEHFALRKEMVSANSGIRSELFSTSSVDDVIVGKNGWLYYAATLDDYQHKNSVSERMLFNMAHNVALMQEYSETLGKTMLFTIAPNKNSLYDENMPERLRYQVAGKSDAQRLLPWLERENVHYADLFRLFEEQEEVLYYARDSHWNEKGAVMVYNALLDACGKPHETYEGAEPVQKSDYFGDLGAMLFPTDEKPESRLVYPGVDSWHYAEGTQVEDPFIRTENEEGKGNLLMYRDSFGNSLLPYMAQCFSQAVFSKRVPYQMSDLVTCEPDIVIVEKVERHLPTLGTVPPLMSAPVRETGKAYVSVKDTKATAELSKEGSYWKLEGMADPAYMNTDSRIYVEVDDGSGAKLYEAFCVSRSDAESREANDYGYMLYLSEISVTGDTFDVRVMIEQEEAMVVLLDKET